MKDLRELPKLRDSVSFLALGDGYVSDPRFTAHYDAYGEGTAVYVRDAMRAFAERELRE